MCGNYITVSIFDFGLHGPKIVPFYAKYSQILLDEPKQKGVKIPEKSPNEEEMSLKMLTFLF